MPERDPDRLSADARVHVVRDAARTYRDELRRLRGVELSEWDALVRLGYIAGGARPVELDVEPEAWSARDEEHDLVLLVRVLRWSSHAVVLAVGVREASAPTISGAGWTEAALDQYASSRGLERDVERAAAELTLAIHWAVPVDDCVRPERWRARTGVDRLDVSLAVQRVDRRGTPLVVAAEGRDLRQGRDRRRRR